VNRAALPAPEQASRACTAAAPRDEVEAELVRLWAGFFPGQEIGIATNFFDAGGDSLLAVRLMAQIEARWGRSLPLSTLFSQPTVAALAESLRDGAAVARRGALVPIRPGGARPPLFFVHPVSGDVLCYAELARRLGPEQPFYGLQAPDADPPLDTVAALAARYVAEVVGVAPTGPLRIGGWSMGGVVALEMAQQLTAAGREVELLALVDLLEPPGPGRAEVDEAALLGWFARDLAGLAGVDAPHPTRLAGGLAALREWAVGAAVLPADIEPSTLGAIFERFGRNSRALSAYRPGPYAGRVVFFRAADGGCSAEVAAAWRTALAGGAAGSVAVLDVPGDHYTVMQPPLVAALVAALAPALQTNDLSLPTSEGDLR
jgi:thioesterase domain-containing protein